MELPEDDGVYVVERILARSLEKTRLPNGRSEYLYLVRWEGYAPRDDTWEPESVVLDGAEDLVRRFNARGPFSALSRSAADGDGLSLRPGHPFTILASRGRNPRSYHVQFGLDSPCVARSPFYQEMWMTIPALKDLICVSASSVDRVVERYHSGKQGPNDRDDKSVMDNRAQDEGDGDYGIGSRDDYGKEAEVDGFSDLDDEDRPLPCTFEARRSRQS